MIHRQRRRLAQLHTHLQGVAAAEEPDVYDGGFIITSTLDEQPAPPVQADGSLTAQQIAGYVARGFINLPPEHLGMPAEHHESVYANHRAGREAFGIAGQPYGSHFRDNVFNHMDANPGVLQVLTCPALVAAVGSLLGPDWAIVPYANSTIEADAGDQHWHK